MPKKYSKPCDHCGEPYEGYGARFCSLACAGAGKGTAPEPSAPQAPDESLTVEVDSEWGHIAVAASSSIRDPETLFAKSGLDPRVWEIVPDSGKMRKWDVPMKVDEEPVVIPCYYVACNVRKRWEATDLPRPLVLSVTRPKLPGHKPGAFASVHYSDIHFPHHDEQALNILYQVLDFVQPGLTVDHGDTLDCQEISKYPKDPDRRVSLLDETKLGARHCGIVHDLTPGAEHWWLEGNHEERMKRLIWGLAENRQAGEILAVPEVRQALEWGSLLGLDSMGWEVVPYPRHRVLFDRIICKHGSVVRKGSAATAKAEHGKYGKSGISGHTHRRGVYESRDHNGHHIWVELGMLGKIRDDYVDFPDWHQGFAVVTWSDDRKHFGVESVRVHEGVAYFRGRRFEGTAKAFSEVAA